MLSSSMLSSLLLLYFFLRSVGCCSFLGLFEVFRFRRHLVVAISMIRMVVDPIAGRYAIFNGL